MRGGLKLGRLFGIELTADWSWVFIFLLVTWNLTAVFSAWHPDWTPGTSLVLAVIAAVLFFSSVVMHELAHALVAKAFGMRVRRITLFLFGGVSNIEREPPSPRSEFLMALVGPVTSFVLGVALLALGFLLAGAPELDPARPWGSIARLDPVATVFIWLGSTNVMLALFNLIPGFPLDGGRLLRAALWGGTGDLHRATRIASWVGQGFGALFVVLGIAMAFGAHVPLLGGGFVGGLWIAFIGLFLNGAAQQSYQRLLMKEVLEGVTVDRVMHRSFGIAPPHATIAEVVSGLFMQSSERAFPVVEEDGRLEGLVSASDVRHTPRDGWATTRVESIMTPADRLVVASPDDDLDTTLTRLAEKNVEQMPVVVDGQLVGMLDRRDLARWVELQLGPRTPMRHAGAH